MFKKFLQWIVEWFTPGKPNPYKTVFTEELPERLAKDTLYILGEGEYLWSAAMICPCGCGEVLQMSLHVEGRPRWKVTFHSDGTVSLWPSVNRKIGCRSHFFFERGHVRWCAKTDFPNTPRKAKRDLDYKV